MSESGHDVVGNFLGIVGGAHCRGNFPQLLAEPLRLLP